MRTIFLTATFLIALISNGQDVIHLTKTSQNFEKQLVKEQDNYRFVVDANKFIQYFNAYIADEGNIVREDLRTQFKGQMEELLKTSTVINADTDVKDPFKSWFGVILHNYLMEAIPANEVAIYSVQEGAEKCLATLNLAVDSFKGDHDGGHLETMNSVRTSYTTQAGDEVYMYTVTVQNKN